MLPDLVKDAHKKGVTILDCSTCPRELDEYVRREMHCGFLARAVWVGPKPRHIPPMVGGASYDTYGADVCPGWLVRQPLIEDISKAHRASEKGELATFFPDPPNVIVEGVLELGRAFDAFLDRKTPREGQA